MVDIAGYARLEGLLPEGFVYKVTRFEQLARSGSFNTEIRSNIFDKKTAEIWLKTFEDITGTNFRVRKSFKGNSQRLVFKKEYRCHRNTRIQKDAVVLQGKHVGCLARILITVKNRNMEWSNDIFLKDFPCVLTIRHDHCHSINVPDDLKYRRPLPEVREKFIALFAANICPSEALKLHKADLQKEYGEKFSEVVEDNAKCPNLQWCYHLYYSIYKKGVKAALGRVPKRKYKSKRKVKLVPVSQPVEACVIEHDGEHDFYGDDVHFSAAPQSMEVSDASRDDFQLCAAEECSRESESESMDQQIATIDGLEEEEEEIVLDNLSEMHSYCAQMNNNQADEEVLEEQCNEIANNESRETLDSLLCVFDDVKLRLESNPESFLGPVQHFVSSFRKLLSGPESALTSALENFGSSNDLQSVLQKLVKSHDSSSPNFQGLPGLCVANSVSDITKSFPTKPKIIVLSLKKPNRVGAN